MTVTLHILNASGALDGIEARLKSVFAPALAKITALMQVDRVDVTVKGEGYALPQTGIGGYSPSAYATELVLNAKNEKLLENFDEEFTATLGHELHHCLRWRGPGYGRTLGEALASEGLACHFETELRGGKVPFYADAVDAAALPALWRQAQDDLGSKNYNHANWFFGAKEGGLPPYAGYTLGFRIVDAYVKKKGVPASQLWGRPAGDFFFGEYLSGLSC